jgi:hypothetical protein
MHAKVKQQRRGFDEIFESRGWSPFLEIEAKKDPFSVASLVSYRRFNSGIKSCWAATSAREGDADP